MCQMSITFCSMSLGVQPTLLRTLYPLPLYVSEWVAQVHIGAQLHRPLPHALCALCPFSLGPCSIGATVCVVPAFKKAFEILPTTHLPLSLLKTNVQLSSNLGKMWVKI